MCRMGTIWGTEMTEKVVWHVVKQYAGKVGILKLAPHDLRRSCARLCHSAGGELEQIQFLLGHVSVQTTEKYLGCKQRLREAVRLRCAEAMKTAGRENPNRWAKVSSNRAHGADGQNRSCSIKWAAKQEKFRPMRKCFFLTSPLQKPLHVCASVIWKPSLLAFFLRNSICCRRYLCS